jgi:hypothetical protein
MMKRSFDDLKREARNEIDYERQFNASNRLLSKVAGHTIDSGNWTGLFDADKLNSIYAKNGAMSVTFKPPIQCKMSSESADEPADVIAVLVSGPPVSKKARASRKKSADNKSKRQ